MNPSTNTQTYGAGPERVGPAFPPSRPYMLGHTRDEQRRLDEQGQLFRPATERLLRDAGIGAGQRVLDVGCGTGSVTSLAAERVGPSGSVVGIDRSPDVLATAREHTAALDLQQASFAEADLATFATEDPFDAVIGRFVLVHQPNPVATLRHLADLVRPGGVLAFAESVCLLHVLASPRLTLLDQLLSWVLGALRAAGVPTDFGVRMFDVFVEAGLSEPEVRLEPLSGIGDDPLLASYAVETVRTLMPVMQRFGIATSADIELETLEARVHQELGGSGLHCGVILGTAWSRVRLAP